MYLAAMSFPLNSQLIFVRRLTLVLEGELQRWVMALKDSTMSPFLSVSQFRAGLLASVILSKITQFP